MKFSVFADIHRYPGGFMGGTEEDMALIQRRAEEEKVDFIIHAGDFCHGPSGILDYLKLYNDFHIPSYHCLGNHDTDKTAYEETLKLYNMPDGHYYFDDGGYRFIICDPNYYCIDGVYTHYSLGNYYKHGPYRDYMPPEQLAWLRETIDAAPGPCVLISHESFERESNGVKNYAEVRKIINDANRRRPHSVLLCINGHYHRDFIRILDGVCYFDLNSASFDWLEKAHDLYPKDLCQQISMLAHTVVYDDPIHAIITLEGTHIKIDGMESTMFMGITREMTGNPKCDPAGRMVTPTVQSADITL